MGEPVDGSTAGSVRIRHPCDGGDSGARRLCFTQRLIRVLSMILQAEQAVMRSYAFAALVLWSSTLLPVSCFTTSMAYS